MIVTINKSRASGEASAPPSKSISHRALICAALSSGSEITGIAYSEDIKATLECLQRLGARVEYNKNGVFIGGLNPKEIKSTVINCRESGSTLRFLLPLCMLSGEEITLTGSERLMSRGLQIYEKIAKDENISFKKGDKSVTVAGKLRGGEYSVDGGISSQFISGLMFALPFCEKPSTIKIEGQAESTPYIELTLDMLSNFGVQISAGENQYFVKKSIYKPFDYSVEGDCSNAAFLDAFNLLSGSVKVLGLNEKTRQGDYKYREMFKQLSEGKRSFELSNYPDLAPCLFALAAALGGAEFDGTRRLKIKESDRASAMAEELLKFGIKTRVFDDKVIIEKGELQKPKEILCGHNDHRIVMALSLLLTVTGGQISGAEAVAKSYPDFFNVIKTLGIGLETDET